MHDFEDGPTDPHSAIPAGTRIDPHGEKTGDELLADVLADPTSDDLRMVYADYLLERGNPRGEFIALQLARHRSGELSTDRERDLFVAHLADWTQPLYNGLAHESIRFHRGFLAACRTLGTLALRDAIGHPLWATVEELDSDELALVVNPCLRSLRSLTTRVDVLARLSRATHEVRLATADLSRSAFSDDDGRPWSTDWEDVIAVGALVQLRALVLRIDFDEVGPFAPLLASRLGRQLADLLLVVRAPYPLARWCAVVREHASLGAVGCRWGDGGAVVTLERERVVLELRGRFDEGVVHTLQSFAGSAVRRLVIVCRPNVERATLEAVVRRLASVFLEIEPQVQTPGSRA